MDSKGDFQPEDAGGFIRIQALRLKEYQRFKEQHKNWYCTIYKITFFLEFIQNKNAKTDKYYRKLKIKNNAIPCFINYLF